MLNLIVRHPTQIGKGLDAAAAVVPGLVAYFIGIFQHCRVRRLQIKARNATHTGIGHHRVQMRADHAGAITGASPFGKPAAFAISLHPAFDNLSQAIWIEQRQ